MDETMTGGELQTVREWLGLTTDALARLLADDRHPHGVRHDQVRKWEAGRAPIPGWVRAAVERIEADTATAVGELVTALQDARDPAVVLYRSDVDFAAARPDAAHLTARWWRHVVARAVTEVPGVAIGTRTELEALAARGAQDAPSPSCGRSTTRRPRQSSRRASAN